MAFEEPESPRIEDWYRRAFADSFPHLKPIVVTAKQIELEENQDWYCERVCQPIRHSAVVVADLSYDNTCVGYEVALSHNAKAPLFLMMDESCGRMGRTPGHLQKWQVSRYRSYDALVHVVRSMGDAVERRFEEAKAGMPEVKLLP